MSRQGRKIDVQTSEDQVASVKLKCIFWYYNVQLNIFSFCYTINENLKEQCKAVSRCKM
jgi:hypothetical protein